MVTVEDESGSDTAGNEVVSSASAGKAWLSAVAKLTALNRFSPWDLGSGARTSLAKSSQVIAAAKGAAVRHARQVGTDQAGTGRTNMLLLALSYVESRTSSHYLGQCTNQFVSVRPLRRRRIRLWPCVYDECNQQQEIENLLQSHHPSEEAHTMRVTCKAVIQ